MIIEYSYNEWHSNEFPVNCDVCTASYTPAADSQTNKFASDLLETWHFYLLYFRTELAKFLVLYSSYDYKIIDGWSIKICVVLSVKLNKWLNSWYYDLHWIIWRLIDEAWEVRTVALIIINRYSSPWLMMRNGKLHR